MYLDVEALDAADEPEEWDDDETAVSRDAVSVNGRRIPGY